MPIKVQCGDPAFDSLPELAREWLELAGLSLAMGQTVRAPRAGSAPVIALRELYFSLGGAAFYESDMRSALDVFLRAPLPDGSLFSSFRPLEESPPSQLIFFDDRIRNVRLERDELDPQTESFAILATHRAWQASGDTSWMQSHLPVLQRALESVFHHPHRWSHDLELPKRAFTLDSWPIAFGATEDPNPEPRNPLWCVHPGDAALLFAACNALAKMCDSGKNSDGEIWRARAAHLEAQTNSVGWNGNFYTHQIHLVPARVRGVDEARQLAACNLTAMNCGLAGQEQCAAILKEYQRRRELNLETSFCEWWSLQPPFPESAFGIAPGRGANGGIWPRLGAGLARAAFDHGYESYGVETLRRFYELTKNRRVFPAYFFDGSPLRDHDLSLPFGASAHDAASGGAFLQALVEGLCGVRDDDHALKKITLAPRWSMTGMTSAEVEISYSANPAYVNYRWSLEGGRLTLDYESQAKHVAFHILLPRGNTPERVALNGRTHAYALISIEKSKYVAFETDRKRATVAITLK